MAKFITYILADDEELFRDSTSQYLDDIPGLKCLAICKDAYETREKVLVLQPDLLILDVEMPGLNGVQLVKSLKISPFIIFITSHTQYAVDAFELDALDYLVKPVYPERLLRAIDKVKMLAGLQEHATSEDTLRTESSEWFFIKEKNIFVRIGYQDLLYIESLGNFSTFHLKDGRKRIGLVSLANVEDQLQPRGFIRINRSHVVNKRHITAIESEMAHLNLIQLPIGKSYTEKVLQAVVGNQAIRRISR